MFFSLSFSEGLQTNIILESHKTPTNYIDSLRYVPLDPDKILSGCWGLVAICVTQPLCPFNVPLRVKHSVMMYRFSWRFRQIEHRLEPRWRSMRGKRKRESAGHDFRTGHETHFIWGRGGRSHHTAPSRGAHTCPKWRGDRHIVLSGRIFYFSTDFHCMLAVLAEVCSFLIHKSVLCASLYISGRFFPPCLRNSKQNQPEWKVSNCAIFLVRTMHACTKLPLLMQCSSSSWLLL